MGGWRCDRRDDGPLSSGGGGRAVERLGDGGVGGSAIVDSVLEVVVVLLHDVHEGNGTQRVCRGGRILGR